MHVRPRERFPDVLVARDAGAVALSRQLEPERRPVRVVARRALAGSNGGMPMLLLQSIRDVFVAGDAQLGRVTTRAAAFEHHATPAVRNPDDMARTATTSSS